MAIFYIVLDPFKVIWHYDLYYQSDDFIQLNRGFVSAMHYANHHEEYHYDSYIFGNSGSIAYHEEDWKKYIPETSVCYHFDVFGGSVGDLYGGIKYVSRQGDLKNVLMILDIGSLSTSENKGILFSVPPILKKSNLFKFHIDFFMAFYKIDFFLSYIDYRMNQQFNPDMEGRLINPNWKLGYNPINNELIWEKQEESIEKGTYYDANRIRIIEQGQFPEKVAKPGINKERMDMIRKMKAIFDAQMTNYRIVIGPSHNQVRINPDDLQFLYDVFGQEYVFDFSGINRWIFDYHNYYDAGHYRSCVANEIMQIVYSKK